MDIKNKETRSVENSSSSISQSVFSFYHGLTITTQAANSCVLQGFQIKITLDRPEGQKAGLLNTENSANQKA